MPDTGLRNNLVRTVPAVVAAAVAGGLGTRPRSSWYVALSKPPWQPPAAAFGPAWTTLYALIAGGTARAMAAADSEQRAPIERALWLNLGLNAGWSWLFFTLRRPDVALAEIVLLNVSNADLTRRVARVDAVAAATLAPYVAWTAFATCLNAAIWHRNRGGPRPGSPPS
jgi:translocator protein